MSGHLSRWLSKSWAGSYLTIVLVFYAITSTGFRGWPTHYPSVHPLSKIGYHPTQQSLKLLSLRNPIISYATVHNQCLFLKAQLTCSLIDTGGGYDLRSSEHKNRTLSSFSSSILHFSLVALPSLKLCHIPKAKAVIHIGPPSIEMSLLWGVFQQLIFY
jgi:hypothetical protein